MQDLIFPVVLALFFGAGCWLIRACDRLTRVS
jgi:hypothetical protein